MINMLTNKDDLAKVSSTPGKTQLLNFFIMNETWCLVDLPGYGYAKVAKSERIDFNQSVGEYLGHRKNLRRVFVLIDSRLEPQKIDLEFIDWMRQGMVPFSLVFTKADKQSAGKTQASALRFTEKLSPPIDDIQFITSSSKVGIGRMEILKTIDAELKKT